MYVRVRVCLLLHTLCRTFITNIYKRFKIIFYGKHSFINVFVYFFNVYCIYEQDRVVLTMLIREGDHFSGGRRITPVLWGGQWQWVSNSIHSEASIHNNRVCYTVHQSVGSQFNLTRADR